MAKNQKADKASTTPGSTAALGGQSGALPPGDNQNLNAAAPKAKETVKPKLPEQLKLASLYGFYDDENTFHSWAEGQVVTDPAHIELLIARGAPLSE